MTMTAFEAQQVILSTQVTKNNRITSLCLVMQEPIGIWPIPGNSSYKTLIDFRGLQRLPMLEQLKSGRFFWKTIEKIQQEKHVRIVWKSPLICAKKNGKFQISGLIGSGQTCKYRTTGKGCYTYGFRWFNLVNLARPSQDWQIIWQIIRFENYALKLLPWSLWIFPQ